MSASVSTMNGERPRVIFFDLDDTLISAYGKPREAWSEAVEAVSDRLAGRDPAQVTEALMASSRAFWSDPERHRIWRQKLKASRRETVRLGLAELGLEDDDLAAEIGDAYSALRDRMMSLFPEAHETLDRLRAAGLRLALVTNGAGEVQRRKIDRFDLEGRFERILIEGEFGAGKPEPAVYRHLLAHFAVAPEEVWMVGDNLEWEVAAPQRHGITGIWANCHGVELPEGSSVRPDHTITRLSELPALLDL